MINSISDTIKASHNCADDSIIKLSDKKQFGLNSEVPSDHC
jgi:hypothetical protein